MKIMKYIIFILAVVQAGSLSAQEFYPDVDLATESFASYGWGNYTLGHDPTSNFGATPTGTVIKVRIKTGEPTPLSNSTTVRLYSDETGTTLVSSSTTGNAISLGSNVYEYTLDTSFDVTSGTQMLAYVSITGLYVDTRTGFTEKYGSWTNDPTSNQSDRFTAIQYVYDVPPAPDLVVIDPSVSDATLTPGQSFTIYATVENQGSVSSSSTTLRYYRSTDSTISTGDTQLGTDPVSALSPNGTSPENITVSAPTTDGTYWVGACVDSVSGESPTNNQCSAGVQITVATAIPPSGQEFYPDVDLATESFSNEAAWGHFTIGHDPTSNWGATPTGTVIKVRIRTRTTTLLYNSTTVRLYSDNTGTTLVDSSTTGNAISLGSDVYEYTLDTPFDVTSGTQMPAYVSITSIHSDSRTGFTEKYGTGTNNPTNQWDQFTAIQYVYDVPPGPGRRRVIITE